MSWSKNLTITLHTYSYSVWKAHNDVLHKDAKRTKYELPKQNLQDRIADLYTRGRGNLTPKELVYFKLLLEQRQRKWIEAMSLWIKLVEAIFRKRGEAHQQKLDEWITRSSLPDQHWKDKYKEVDKDSTFEKNTTDISYGGRSQRESSSSWGTTYPE